MSLQEYRGVATALRKQKMETEKKNMKYCKGSFKKTGDVTGGNTKSWFSSSTPEQKYWGGTQVWFINPIEAIYMKYTRKCTLLCMGWRGETQRGLFCSSALQVLWLQVCTIIPICYSTSPFNFTSKLVIKLKNTKKLKGPLDSDAKHLKKYFSFNRAKAWKEKPMTKRRARTWLRVL